MDSGVRGNTIQYGEDFEEGMRMRMGWDGMEMGMGG